MTKETDITLQKKSPQRNLFREGVGRFRRIMLPAEGLMIADHRIILKDDGAGTIDPFLQRPDGTEANLSDTATPGAHTLDSGTHTDVSAVTEAKGQLLVQGGTNWAALSVGSNGTVLIAASGQTLGVRWGGANIVMGDNSVTGIDTLTFTDVNGTIAGIQNQNLLDKSATETVSGAYTFSDATSVIGGVTASNLLDKSATEIVTGVGWTFNNNIASNFVLGVGAGASIEAGAANNVLIGDNAGNSLTTGDKNVFIGDNAGATLITTANATCIGYRAGANMTNGTNVCIGTVAGEDMTTGTNNMLLGTSAGTNITQGSNIVAIGTNTGDGVTTAGNFVLIGTDAGGALKTGSNSVYIGHEAGKLATSADLDVIIGSGAGVVLTTGRFNILIGRGADVTTNSHSSAIVIGYEANSTAANQCIIGSQDDLGRIADFYLGNGVTQATPLGTTVQSTGGSGTNIAGADFDLAGGKGTGTAVGGAVALQVSPATGDSDADLNPLVDVVKASATGTATTLGFYNTAPVALQAGVAVTAAGVHAALVNLGLITA